MKIFPSIKLSFIGKLMTESTEVYVVSENKLKPQNSEKSENSSLSPVEASSITITEIGDKRVEADVNQRLEDIEKQQESLAKEKESLLKQKSVEISHNQEPNSEVGKNAELDMLVSQLVQKMWKAEYEAVVGLKHRKTMPPSPCQDAAFATIDLIPRVITADGAGSATTSDIGAQRVVSGVNRLIDTLYNVQFSLLDKPEPIDEDVAHRWALLLVKHAKGILKDLADEYRRDIKDFSCTLLTALVGKYHTFWFKVGDGALVCERLVEQEGKVISLLEHLGQVGKGEFANHTKFISENLDVKDVDSGILDSSNISAVFSMSDGAAFKFVSTDGEKVAKSLSAFANDLRESKLQRYALTKFFYSDNFLKEHDGDDCSLALIAR